VTSNQGLRRVLIKKLTIIARKPTEIGEAVLHCDLRNVCHHRVAAQQGIASAQFGTNRTSHQAKKLLRSGQSEVDPLKVQGKSRAIRWNREELLTNAA
jgi:hypothetical protein